MWHGSKSHDVPLDDKFWNIAKRAAFSSFIHAWRDVNPSESFENDQWDKTSRWLAEGYPAQKQILLWHTTNNPTVRAKSGVYVSTVIYRDGGPITNDTWSVNWGETTIKDGSAKMVNYNTRLTYVVTGEERGNKDDSRDEMVNGLGIYVKFYTGPDVVRAFE
jgi:type IV secretory pathway TrbF-like protein